MKSNKPLKNLLEREFGLRVKCESARIWQSVRAELKEVVDNGLRSIDNAEDAAFQMEQSPLTMGILTGLINKTHKLVTGIDLMTAEGWKKIFRNKTRQAILNRLTAIPGVSVIILD